jgi:cytochrome P450
MLKIARDTTRFSSRKFFVPEERNPPPAKAFLPAMVDPPLHTAYRRIIMPLFSPTAIGQLEDRIRAFSDKLIGTILAGSSECEFMREYAHVMPVAVFLSLMDFPITDCDQLRKISARVNDPGGNREVAMDELFDYLRPKIEERITDSGDDAVSHIVRGKVDGRPLTKDEMQNLMITILLGGLDTVASQLGFFAHYLAQNRDDRNRLIEEPQLIRTAVDEMLRRYSIGTFGRIVAEDTVLQGVNMRKGDLIAWTTRMSALNETLYSDPLKVDFDRPRAVSRSFGDGVHQCAGAFLARTELRIFLETWLPRVPDFSLKPGFIPEWAQSNTIAYKRLPLVIGGRS